MKEEIPIAISSSFSSCCLSYFASFLLAIIYVGSLYVWKTKEASTHPETIKRRFISVFLVTLVSPYYVSYFINEELLQQHSLWRIFGLRLDGLLPACTLPVLLTVILFLGPLSMEAFGGIWRVYMEPRYWLDYMKEWISIRNYIVAPISEEFTFRACMLSLIIHCTAPKTAIFVCPLFFGAAHLHHMYEQIRMGAKWKVALAISSFQFLYTSIFGAYSAYLYLRTGHLIAPILVHSYCNHMGFPDFGALAQMPQPKKTISVLCYIFGLILWVLLVEPLTEPSIYQNNLPWSSQV